METALGIVNALGIIGGFYGGWKLMERIPERHPFAYPLAYACMIGTPAIGGIAAVQLCLWMG